LKRGIRTAASTRVSDKGEVRFRRGKPILHEGGGNASGTDDPKKEVPFIGGEGKL